SSDAMARARVADDTAPEMPATTAGADPHLDPPGQAALPTQEDAASQHADDDGGQSMMRRTHGGALPR
ncbi:MAG: hypothetical protein ACTHLY_13410, partial [Pseudolabrys sp.]